jgi:hypothetical protein
MAAKKKTSKKKTLAKKAKKKAVLAPRKKGAKRKKATRKRSRAVVGSPTENLVLDFKLVDGRYQATLATLSAPLEDAITQKGSMITRLVPRAFAAVRENPATVIQSGRVVFPLAKVIVP